MWFKNLKVYQFSQPFDLSDQLLEEKLSSATFSPCTQHQISSYGWTSPLGKITNNTNQMMVHASKDFVLFCTKEEQKLLPAAVINDLLQEKIAEIEAKEGHKPGKKQRDQLKEELVIDLLPRAFSRFYQNFAYIDRINQLIIIDAASNNKAEQLTEFLRKTLGSLPIVPIKPNKPIELTLTSWLSEQNIPEQLITGQSCELKDPAEDGGIIRCSKHDLNSDEIKIHIEAGKMVTKLALTWQDKIEFILHDDLSIKRVRLTDTFLEQMDDETDDDAIAHFDADFNLMALEFSQFIPSLLSLFDLDGTPSKTT
ncbi:MAG: recombination-associated protein RdgC [Pseudomonadota bacterium]